MTDGQHPQRCETCIIAGCNGRTNTTVDFISDIRRQNIIEEFITKHGCASYSNVKPVLDVTEIKMSLKEFQSYELGVKDGKQQERKRIAKLLEPFEWSGSYTDYEDSWAVMTRACPFCFNARKDGHKKNCLFVSLQEG